MPAEHVVGVFGHIDTTADAVEQLKARGFRDMTVYTPIPVHEIEDVVERGRPLSKVRLFTLIGGLTGTATGFFLTIWSSLKWGLVVGGKPIASIPPFVIIAFELTILFGGLCTVLAVLLLGRLPRFRPSPGFDPRFTNDKFGVAVHCRLEDRQPVRELLRKAGAEEVKP
jgi:hypothetical protein